MPEPTDLDDHEATTELGDGRERCAACGYLWPCPPVRRAPKPQTPEALAVVEMIGFGWGVWKRQPHGATPVGGIVVGWTDEDNGRRYSVLHFPHARSRIFRMDADEIDAESIQLPNVGVIRGYARRLSAENAACSGLVDSAEVERAASALTLYRGVA